MASLRFFCANKQSQKATEIGYMLVRRKQHPKKVRRKAYV